MRRQRSGTVKVRSMAGGRMSTLRSTSARLRRGVELDGRGVVAVGRLAGARVGGLADGDAGEDVPAVEAEGKRELGAEVEAPGEAGGGEVRLHALEAGGGGGDAPEEGRAGDGVVEAGEVDGGHVVDLDLFAGAEVGLHDLEAFVAVDAGVEGEAVLLLGEVEDGGDVGADGLVEVGGEGLAVDVGAEVLDVADGADVGGELTAEAGGDVLAALVVEDGDGLACGVDAGRVEAAILQGGEVGVEEVVADAVVAEGAVLGEAAQRVVDGADGEVGGAAEDEVELFADGEALGAGVLAGAGVAEFGNEEAGLALLIVDRMGDVGEEEQRQAEQLEGGVGGLGLAAVEGDLAGEELPVGVRAEGRW